MKKRWKLLILIIIFLFLMPITCFASEEKEASTEEILKSQQDTLDIGSFIKEAQKYTNNTFEELNLNDLFTSALTGNINNTTIAKSILNLIGKEVIDCTTILLIIL